MEEIRLKIYDNHIEEEHGILFLFPNEKKEWNLTLDRTLEEQNESKVHGGNKAIFGDDETNGVIFSSP